MSSHEPAEESNVRLCRERKFFRAAAICCVALLGLALPRKIERYRELKQLNARLVDFQRAIVANQQQVREIQAEILSTQQEIRRRMAR